MQIIPSHKIRAKFRSEFNNRRLSTEQKRQVKVVREVLRLEEIQINFINMAVGQKKEYPELATQHMLEKLVKYRVSRRIKKDLYGQIVVAA